MKKKFYGIIAVFLAAATVASFAGCAKKNNQSSSSQSGNVKPVSAGSATDLLKNAEMLNFEGTIEDTNVDPLYTDFAVRLAQNTNKDGENFYISPISVMYGLALAANGAHGDTLTQFEKTLGGSTYTLNRYFYFAMEGEYQNDSAKFNIGNSLWINSMTGYKPDKKYLNDVRTFFDAAVLYDDFENVGDNMGTWLKSKGVAQNTKFIPEATDSMTSVNSLALTADWSTYFTESATKTEKFTGSDGKQSDVDMMNGYAEYYIKDNKSEGFTKTFDGNCYGFAAIMPNEGVSIEDYIKSMTGKNLTNMFKSAEQKDIAVAVPKFSQTTDYSFKDTLTKMGITDAFDSDKADFIAMGTADTDLYLSNVIGEAEISVNEKAINKNPGTTKKITSMRADKKITLNRPFVYVIYDLSSKIPKYIGAYKKAGA